MQRHLVANGALDPQLPGPLAALGPCRSCILNKAEPAGFEDFDVPQPKRVGRPPKMDAANAAAHARMNTSVSLPSQDRIMVKPIFLYGIDKATVAARRPDSPR